MALISGPKTLMFTHFLVDIIIPPDVVLPFSYIRGLFVYCPFLLDLFTPERGFLFLFLRDMIPVI